MPNKGSIKKWWNKNSRRDKILLLAGVILLVGLLVYSQLRGEEKEVKLSLSNAIMLSQAEIFSEMVVVSDGSMATLELVVVDEVEYSTIDIDGKGIVLNDGGKVTVDVGRLNIKELEDMGFVLPAVYSTKYGTSEGVWIRLLPNFVLIGVCVLFYYLYAGGYFGVGTKFKKGKNNVRLEDIGGLAEIKESVTDVISFLKDMTYYDAVGARIPHGILLVGSPGTGKTMLACAIATEADVPFYFVSGSEFHSMWVGLAGMRVKGLFKKANRSRSIVYIDEFDSIAHQRTMASGDASREWNHTLNQLLAEMDGFKKNSKVLVMAATNRVDVLDPAVLRPGRFDRKIVFQLPNYKERSEILRIHSKGKPFSDDVRLGEIAKQTTGFSGADLALLINEAAICAAKEHKNTIGMNNLTKSIDKVLVGDERKGFVITKDEKKAIACHEAGHAIVASFIPDGDRVERITILPHGNTGGFTRMGQEVESFVVSKSEAMRRISVLLGGRVAEETIGDVTSGAQDDIKKANDIARQMVEQYGMGDAFGLRCSVTNAMGVDGMGVDIRKVIEADITKILKQCHEIAQKIMNEHPNALSRVTEKLLECETLDGDEIQKLIIETEDC